MAVVIGLVAYELIMGHVAPFVNTCNLKTASPGISEELIIGHFSAVDEVVPAADELNLSPLFS